MASLPTGPYRYDMSADRWMLAGTTRNILGLRPEGRLTAVHGHVVDVGVLVTDRANARIDQAVADVVANRATIEQAKRALSFAYGFYGDGAIALLRWWSSRHNVKVTVLADRLVSAVGTGALSRPQLRAAVDALLASVAALDALNDGVVD